MTEKQSEILVEKQVGEEHYKLDKETEKPDLRPDPKSSGGASTLRVSKRAFGRYTLFVFIAFSILVGGLGVWVVQQFGKLTEQVQGIQVQAEKLTIKQEKEWKKIVEKTAIELAKVDERVSTLEHTFRDLSKQIASFNGSKSEDFVITELDYLLRLANYRLVLEKDPDRALLVMLLLQERLASLGGQEFSALKTQLELDIASLQAAKKINLAQVLTKLSKLMSDLDALDSEAELERPGGSMDDSGDELEGGWGNIFRSVLGNLGEVVEVYQVDARVASALLASERKFVRHNLLSSLQDARWAVIRRNTPLYRLSLDEASYWLSDYLIVGTNISNEFSAVLSQLRSIELSPQLPNLERSINAMKFLVHNFEKTDNPLVRDNNQDSILEIKKTTASDATSTDQVVLISSEDIIETETTAENIGSRIDVFEHWDHVIVGSEDNDVHRSEVNVK